VEHGIWFMPFAYGLRKDFQVRALASRPILDITTKRLILEQKRGRFHRKVVKPQQRSFFVLALFGSLAGYSADSPSGLAPK